ncbi:Ubiquitin-related modifier 1-like protein [Aphelenchoides besseyi]|nr:Ubiquitin-related modifier 1-like protein [Aphelenchoides besseyi]KAI6209885.1 Ubiquitin-related modifier 1-like protein [Aphelenchoides besseyi]
MHLSVTFSGGSEVIFGDKRHHEIDVADDLDVGELIDWISSELVVDKSKTGLLFLDGDVRPGILVLVNDVDWEITGGLRTRLTNKDNVTFISTLHGG